MMYDSQFVICILHNRNTVRESNEGVAYLPFNSEYKIRLKNKHSYLRAKARVWVDGRQVSNLGDFILKPNETLDLERFLDHSMTDGRKFKFVPLADGRVSDPTDPENGIIKVEFHREQDFVQIKPLPWKPAGCRPPYRPIGPYEVYNDDNTVPKNLLNKTLIGSTTFTSNSVNFVHDSYITSNNITPVNDSAGATIEGGYSGQSFTYGDDFLTDVFPVTLTLRIRGLNKGHWDEEFKVVPKQDKKPRKKTMIKFCPNCGAKRHRQADHFCHRCGTAYHPRYERERGCIIE